MTGSKETTRRARLRWLLVIGALALALGALWPRGGPERLVEVPETSITYDVSDGRLFWRTVDRRQNVSTWSMPVTGGKAKLEGTEPPLAAGAALTYPSDRRKARWTEQSIRKVWPALPKQPRLYPGDHGTLWVGPVDETSRDVGILMLEEGADRARVVRRYHTERPDPYEGHGGVDVNIPYVAEAGGWVVFVEEVTEETPDGSPASARRAISACRTDGSDYRVLRPLDRNSFYISGLRTHHGRVYAVVRQLPVAGGHSASTTVWRTIGGGALTEVLHLRLPTDNVFFDGPYAYYVAPHKQGTWLESMMGTASAVSRVLYRVRLPE